MKIIIVDGEGQEEYHVPYSVGDEIIEKAAANQFRSNVSPVTVYTKAFAAIRALKTWMAKHHEYEPGNDISCYMDNDEEVGRELIRFDGEYITGIEFGPQEGHVEMLNKWNECMDKEFVDPLEWEMENHFAANINGFRTEPTGEECSQIRTMIEEFNTEEKRRYDNDYYTGLAKLQ